MISRLYVGHLKYEYVFCGNGKVSICDAGRHFISHVLVLSVTSQSNMFYSGRSVTQLWLWQPRTWSLRPLISKKKILWFLNPDLYSIIFSKMDCLEDLYRDLSICFSPHYCWTEWYLLAHWISKADSSQFSRPSCVVEKIRIIILMKNEVMVIDTQNAALAIHPMLRLNLHN